MKLSLTRVRSALSNHAARQPEGSRFAAVALILRERENGTELLVIERATNPRDPWSGHLAFPGGRQAPEDTTLLDTARRETLEEIGLDLSAHAELLGALDPVRSPRVSDLTVAPFVFGLQTHPALTLAPREVERPFWVELTPLLSGELRTEYALERAGQTQSMPGFKILDRVLWGMSYHMLQSLFALVSRE